MLKTIKQGETAEEAMVRELGEETGLIPNSYVKLFDEIQDRRDKDSIDEMYTNCMDVVADALKVNEIEVKEKSKLVSTFKKELVDDKKVFPKQYIDTLKLVIDTKNGAKTKKLTWPELEKIRREVRGFIKGQN